MIEEEAKSRTAIRILSSGGFRLRLIGTVFAVVVLVVWPNQVFRLSEDRWGDVFIYSILAGFVVSCFVWWRKIRTLPERQPETLQRNSAADAMAISAVLRAPLIGAAVFALLVLSNGILDDSTVASRDAIIADKKVIPGRRGGKSHVVELRVRDQASIFRLSLTEAGFNRVSVGQLWPHPVGKGFWGWPYLAR